MAAPRINIKNIDYFKFKKIVVDGNRDDYNDCSKEVKDLCDTVQTLRFRDEEFDDESDRGRFGEICHYYKQILISKRIDPTDMRIKSGWWGDHKNAYSAGKLKPTALRESLLTKAKAYLERCGTSEVKTEVLAQQLDGPGLYVFKHRDHQCFQYVGRADKIFSRCGEKLKQAFEGNTPEPLAALLIISMSADWDFYFFPVGSEDDDRVLRVLENDLILKHDCIWPHGLNFQLHIDSLLEVSQFRKSCARHRWPPDSGELEASSIDLPKLRAQISKSNEEMHPEDNADNLSLSSQPSGVSTPRKGEKKSTSGGAASKARAGSAAKPDAKKGPTKRPPSAGVIKKVDQAEVPEATEVTEPAEEGQGTENTEAASTNGVQEDDLSPSDTVTKSVSSGSVASNTEGSRDQLDTASATSGDKIPPASPRRQQAAKKKPATPRPTSGKGGKPMKSKLPTSPKKS